MNPLEIIDQLSVDLLVSGNLPQGGFIEHVKTLSAALPDPQSQQLIEKLNACQRDTQVMEAVQILAALKVCIEAQTSAEPEGTHLKYDISHGKDILEVFFAEFQTHLQTVEQQLIILDKDGADQTALQEAFRSMHTLKGNFGFLDLKPACDLAHDAEAVLDRARLGKKALGRTECDTILKTVDMLRDIQNLLSAHMLDLSSPFPAIPAGFAALIDELRAISIYDTPDLAVRAPDVAAQGSTTATLEKSSHVRVHIAKLDILIDGIGELMIAQNLLEQNALIQAIENPRLKQQLRRIHKLSRELRQVSMSMRALPLHDTFSRATRIARDIARKQGKEIEVFSSGGEAEMDKNVLEGLADPLMHLVRNAVDHGIAAPPERVARGKPACGRLTLNAFQNSGVITVELSDDGSGLNYEKILNKARQHGLVKDHETASEARLRELIFSAGFSTAENITDVSGRGVGLDVVKNNIERLGGHVAVRSEPGCSTTFSLHVPLTMAVMDGLIVAVGSERYIIPAASVVESMRPDMAAISAIHQHGELLNFRGMHVPIVRLYNFARIEPKIREPWKAAVIVVESFGVYYALMADEVLGLQPVLIKGLGESLRRTPGISAGAILDDGRVSFILDIAELVQIYTDGGSIERARKGNAA